MNLLLLRHLSLGASVFVASACVVVENFEGYGPLGNGGACDKPPCVTSTSSGSGGGGVGGNGGGASTSSSSASSSSGGPTCPNIACAQMPCPAVEVVANSEGGMLTMDATSIFIGTANQTTTIKRIAKPGCLVPPFEQPAPTPNPDHTVVSDGSFAAWIVNDYTAPCVSGVLRYCDPNNCKPQEINAATAFPDQGEFVRLDLGPNHVYFTMRNGLVGRLAKESTQPETLWIDPGTTGPKKAFLGYPLLAEGKLYATRLWVGDSMSVCSTLAEVATAAIWSSDPIPLSSPMAIATNLSFLGPIAVSPNYVYFHVNSGAMLLNRVPKAGGTIETLNPGTNIKVSSELQNFIMKNGWLYLRAATATGSQLLVRMPANTPIWSADAADIVVETPYMRTFAVDDVAVYWEECVEPVACASYRIMARRLIP